MYLDLVSVKCFASIQEIVRFFKLFCGKVAVPMINEGLNEPWRVRLFGRELYELVVYSLDMWN